MAERDSELKVCYAAKCNTNAKCNNIEAKCNKMFNAKCNNPSTQIVITFLTHNVITQNVIISEKRLACYFKIGIVAQLSVANPDLQLNYKPLLLLILILIMLVLLILQ